MEREDKVHQDSTICLHGAADIAQDNQGPGFLLLLPPSQLYKVLSWKNVIPDGASKIEAISFPSGS